MEITTESNTLTIENIKSVIADVPDFPKPGIIFKDITPLLANPKAFRSMIEHFYNNLKDQNIDQLVAIESRGFLIGSALAYRLGCGMVLARKPGKLPRETVTRTYQLEYGEDRIEIHKDDLKSSDRVAIIDDVLATGGTAEAVQEAVLEIGSEIVSFQFIMDIAFLKGSAKLKSPHQCLFSV